MNTKKTMLPVSMKSSLTDLFRRDIQDSKWTKTKKRLKSRSLSFRSTSTTLRSNSEELKNSMRLRY